MSRLVKTETETAERVEVVSLEGRNCFGMVAVARPDHILTLGVIQQMRATVAALIAILLRVAAASPIDSAAVVASVDALRASHAAPGVLWNASLAQAAQGWADTIARQDRLAHSALGYGENVAMMSAGSDPVSTAISMWYSEGARYDYSSPGTDSATWHFTQLVWLSTARIGAGVSVSASGRAYVVMEFDPPGNFLGEFAANVLPLSASAASSPIPAASPPIPAASPPIPAASSPIPAASSPIPAASPPIPAASPPIPSVHPLSASHSSM